MATEIQLIAGVVGTPCVVLSAGEVAWVSQATCCHAPFGLKPASRGFAAGTPVDDFRPGKAGISN